MLLQKSVTAGSYGQVAKISDFGLASVLLDGATHRSTASERRTWWCWDGCSCCIGSSAGRQLESLLMPALPLLLPHAGMGTITHSERASHAPACAPAVPAVRCWPRGAASRPALLLTAVAAADARCCCSGARGSAQRPHVRRCRRLCVWHPKCVPRNGCSNALLAQRCQRPCATAAPGC